MSTVPEYLSCDYCQKHMKHGNYRKHLGTAHNFDSSEISKILFNLRWKDREKYPCDICSHVCESSEALLRHSHRNHKVPIANNLPKIECVEDDCSLDFNSVYAMSVHVMEMHPDIIVGEGRVIDRVFRTKSEYEVWKEEEKNLYGTQFRISHSRGLADSGRVLYLKCASSGNTSHSTQKKRFGKVKRRVVDVCTADVKVVMSSDGSVAVRGSLFHVGHNLSPASQSMSSKNKDHVLSLLKQGIPPDTILEQCKDQYGNTHRLHYLSSKDIRNLGSGMQPGKLSSDDLSSVILRKERNNREDGFRHMQLSKANESNTCIILITPSQLEALRNHSHRGAVLDDTFCITRYELRLSTLIVIDHKGRGIPAAFMISQKLSSSDVSHMFEAVRQLFPEFNPAYVMTDDTLVFWNGFLQIFPHLKSSTRKVLCRWHILQSWMRKAKSRRENGKVYVENDADQKLLNTNLRMLVRITTHSQFSEQFTKILDWLVDTGCEEYAEYLSTNYAQRKHEWSAVENDKIPFTTSTHAESWHSYLKVLLLNKRKNVRLDALIDVLIRAPNLILGKHQTEDSRGYTTKRQSSNHSRHRSSVELYSDPNQLEEVTSGTWLIPSRSGSNKYTVTVFRNCECQSSRCVACSRNGNKCPCTLKCTCLDQTAGVSCAHSHAVCNLVPLQDFPSFRTVGEVRTIHVAEEVDILEEEVDILEEEVVILEEEVDILEEEVDIQPCASINVDVELFAPAPAAEVSYYAQVSLHDHKKNVLSAVDHELARIHKLVMDLHRKENDSCQEMERVLAQLRGIGDTTGHSGLHIRKDCKDGPQKNLPIRHGYTLPSRKRQSKCMVNAEVDVLPVKSSSYCNACHRQDAPNAESTTLDNWTACSCGAWYHDACLDTKTLCRCGKVVNAN